MAHVADSRTFERIARKAPRYTYDFSKWSDGQVWVLQRGKDFFCTTGSFTSYLYRYAEQIGKKVRTSVRRTKDTNKSYITFQFMEWGDEAVRFPVLEEHVEESCEPSANPAKCVVWDALRDRLGLNDLPVQDSSSGVAGDGMKQLFDPSLDCMLI